MRHDNTPKADPNFQVPHPQNNGGDPFSDVDMPQPLDELHHKGPAGKPMAEHEIWHNAKRQHGVEPH